MLAVCHHLSRDHQYAGATSSRLGTDIDNDACGIYCYERLSDARMVCKGREISYHGIGDKVQRGRATAEDPCAG